MGIKNKQKIAFRGMDSQIADKMLKMTGTNEKDKEINWNKYTNIYRINEEIC